MGGQRERERERTVWPEISTAGLPANTSYVFKDAGNYFCLPLPSLPPVPHVGFRLFDNTESYHPSPPPTTQQLPCNSVPQCQVMQPQILFLSISQYIHNSSSGRYNGFTETLDRGNPIMCSSQPTSIGWLALALRFGVT